ncbi:hypothetical protein D1AOALGA4SA_6153 [Olavius algarvensis Delta 1 endosymbiont]|nr:hypothetical protein D1AOALGA4SA_6153 [Olavius algarvensis Delta 1 endosymbiont]
MSSSLFLGETIIKIDSIPKIFNLKSSIFNHMEIMKKSHYKMI